MKQSTILIVDDVAENLLVMGEILGNYNIKVAKDGEKALSIASNNENISLIILDIMMPGIDGFETCRRLKKNPVTSDIPVIFMTSLSDTEDIVKGFEIGAVDYVTKPIKGKELLARVNTHLTLSLLQKEMKTINKILEEKVVERTSELKTAKEKAEESNKIKTHFLSLMSHELRTPMNGILGYAELLINEVINPECKEYAEGILSSGNRLKETLNSILNLSRFDSLDNKVYPVTFDINESIENIVDSYQFNADQKGITLEQTSNKKKIEFHSDKSMFNVAVNCLINNAVKFTEKGGKVSVSTLLDEESNTIKLIVEDTGIGIPSDKFEMIFDEFRQVDEGQGRNFEGVGLGLTIVKKYVEKLHGKIDLQSELGKGSAFTISLPIQHEQPILNLPKVENIINPLTTQTVTDTIPYVLIVEDDEINIKIVRLFLKRITKKVDIAVNGEEAVKLAEKNQYDIILMDINLGHGIDGIEATHRIRTLLHCKNTPIVAVTAFAFDEDRNNFLANGFSHYLAKPFNGKDLLQTVNTALQKI